MRYVEVFFFLGCIVFAIAVVTRRPWIGRIPRSAKSSQGQCFSIGLAHLQGDRRSREGERALFQALSRLPNIEIISCDITLAAPIDGDAREQAQTVLRDCGADALLWGHVEREQAQTHFTLQWSMLPERNVRQPFGRFIAASKNLFFPKCSLEDVTLILALGVDVCLAEDASAQVRSSRSVAVPVFTHVQALIALPGEKRGDWSGVYALLGDGYRIAAASLGEKGYELQAIEAYRSALALLTRNVSPLRWADGQNRLGFALLTYAEQHVGTARLQEAIECFAAALQEYSLSTMPLDWAAVQNNLGLALTSLGERKESIEHIASALKAFEQASQVYVREQFPLSWAMVQHNTGLAYQSIGEMESGVAALEKAVALYRAALEERTRQRVPLHWAVTQNTLGSALQTLGDRVSGTQEFLEAIQAYRAALEVRTREYLPMQWAMTQNNLAIVLQMLGERTESMTWIEDAIVAYREALKERTRERAPRQWAATQYNLGTALLRLGREQEAQGCFQASAQV